jgi:hypothetical protein
VVDTLAEIAQALARAISAGGGGFAATTEGNRLVVAGPAAAVLSASVVPLASSGGVWGVPFAGATVAIGNLSGTPVTGDTYRVDLDGVTVLHIVGTGEGREAVARALAASINNSNLLAAYSAIGDGGVLMILHRANTAFSPVFALTRVTHPAARDFVAATDIPTLSANTLSWGLARCWENAGGSTSRWAPACCRPCATAWHRSTPMATRPPVAPVCPTWPRSPLRWPPRSMPRHNPT